MNRYRILRTFQQDNFYCLLTNCIILNSEMIGATFTHILQNFAMFVYCFILLLLAIKQGLPMYRMTCLNEPCPSHKNIHPKHHQQMLQGPEVIKLFSCSTQLSMKIFPLINVKMSTIVGILTFMSKKNSILGLSEPEKIRIS